MGIRTRVGINSEPEGTEMDILPHSRNLEPGTRPASDIQIKSIQTQCRTRKVEENQTTASALAMSRRLWKQGYFSYSVAENLLDFLRGAERKSHEELRSEDARSAPVSAPPEAPEGMHQKNGFIFKVQRSPKTGRVYAKRLDPESGHFDYTPGAVYKLNADTYMTKEQAKAFGALYGTCVRCSRTLTAEDSIDRMMGPICYEKQFG